MARINETSGQVSDSSQGVSPEDIGYIAGESASARSGAEASIMEDSSPGAGKSKLSNARAYPDAVLTDEEAGYDQAAYDEQADSFDDSAPSAPFRGPASVEEEMPKGALQIKTLREEGVPESDIKEWREDREKVLREEQVPEELIKEYFGDPAFDQAPMDKYIHESGDWHAPMVGAPGRHANTLYESFVGGLEGSSMGLAARGELPDYELKPDASLSQTLAHSVGMVLGDIIPGTAGAIGFGLAGTAASANPIVGAGAGAFGAGFAPAGMRKALAEYYKKGQVTDAQDFWDRLTGAAASAVKEGTISLATLGAGAVGGGKLVAPLVSRLESEAAKGAVKVAGKVSAEALTMGTAGAAVEGRMPDLNDFEQAAVMVAGLNTATHLGSKVVSKVSKSADAALVKNAAKVEAEVAGGVKDRLLTTYAETGLTPHDVLALAEKDPVLHRELLEEGTGVPKSLESYKDTNGHPDFIPETTTIEIKEAAPESMGGGEVSAQLELPYDLPREGVAAMGPEPTPGTIAPETGPVPLEPSPRQRFTEVKPEDLAKLSEDAAYKLIGDRILNPDDPNSLKAKLKNYSDPASLRRWLVDENDPILQFQKELTGTKTNAEAIRAIPASKNTYVLARNFKGVVGKSIVSLTDHTFDFHTFKKNGEALTEILKPYKDDLELGAKFRAYLAAERAREVALQNKEPGFDATASLKVIEAGREKFGADARRVVEYQNRILKYAKDSGVISDDAYSAMVRDGQNFIPFRRVIDGIDDAQSGGRTLNPKDPTHALKGADLPIVDPIESIVRRTHEYIAMAERNRVMRSLRELIQEKAKDAPEILTKLERVGVEQGKEVILKNGEKEIQYRKLENNEVAEFINGERHVFKVSEDVAAAIKSSNSAEIGLIVSLMAKPATIMRAGATLGWDFVTKNIFRDQIHAWLFSKSGYIPYYDYVRGAFDLVKHESSYTDWLKGGGMNAVENSIGRDYIHQNVMKIARETGFLKTAQNVVSSPLELLRTLAEFGESPTRIGEFKNAKAKIDKAGATEIDATIGAAFESRNVTLDFQRRGAYTSALNMITPFLNARIQGIAQVYDAYKDRRFDVAYRGAALTAASITLWFLNRKEPWYKELRDYQKDMFWIFAKDDWKPAREGEENLPNARMREDGTFEVNYPKLFRVPKPQEPGLIFGSMVERGLDAFEKHDPEAVKALGKAFLEQFNPGIPTAIGLPMELATNYSTFRDKAIVPYFVEKELPHLRATPYTTSVAKFISQKMFEAGISEDYIPAPAKIDYAVQGLMAGLGTASLNGLSYALEKMGYAEKDLAPKDWDELPGVKAFTIRMGQESKSVDDYFQAAKRQDEWMTSTHVKKGAQPTLSQLKLMESREGRIAAAVRPIFSRTKKAMSEIRKQVATISAIPETDLPKEQKLRLTDQLMWTRIKLANEALSERKAAEKAVDAEELGAAHFPPSEEE